MVTEFSLIYSPAAGLPLNCIPNCVITPLLAAGVAGISIKIVCSAPSVVRVKLVCPPAEATLLPV